MEQILKKSILTILIVALGLNGLCANDDEPQKFSDKLFFGGTLGLTFGTVTQVDIVPIGGIWVIPQWSIGVGGRYTYFSRRSLFQGSQVLRTHIWGISGFTQILPIPDFSRIAPVDVHGGIILHGEYEGLYLEQKMFDPLASLTGKTWIHLYLAGFGYRQLLGERAALNILLLWELSNNRFSPYVSNPILRVNVTF